MNPRTRELLARLNPPDDPRTRTSAPDYDDASHLDDWLERRGVNSGSFNPWDDREQYNEAIYSLTVAAATMCDELDWLRHVNRKLTERVRSLETLQKGRPTALQWKQVLTKISVLEEKVDQLAREKGETPTLLQYLKPG